MLYGLEKFPKRNNFHSGFLSRFSGVDLLEDYTDDHMPGYARNPFPAVNILEFDKDYEIELAAPGLCKKDYEISIQQDTLKVKTVKHFENGREKRMYSRREFANREFEKAFILPENVDTEAISASCMDGILRINIPKKVIEERKSSRSINIR